MQKMSSWEATPGRKPTPTRAILLLRNPKMNAWHKAEVLKHQDELSVILFSHGMRAGRHDYSGLACEWASYGYVVVTSDHTDGSAPHCLVGNRVI